MDPFHLVRYLPPSLPAPGECLEKHLGQLSAETLPPWQRRQAMLLRTGVRVTGGSGGSGAKRMASPLGSGSPCSLDGPS